MLLPLPCQAENQQEGSAYWFLNALVIIKAKPASTGGRFSLCYHIGPCGSATPYHLHHVEDEAFYILEGQSTFTLDGKKIVRDPGDYIFLPRGIPHGIRVTGSVPTKMLILATPGNGFVSLVEEMGETATEQDLPVQTMPDFEKLKRLCAKYEIDLLGPLPE